MSKMPARSENRPARAVNSSGTDRRTADPRTLTKISKKSIRLSSRPGKLLIDAPDRRTQHVLQRPGKQDHEALDHDDHFSRDGRHLEGQDRTSLVKDSEPQPPQANPSPT